MSEINELAAAQPNIDEALGRVCNVKLSIAAIHAAFDVARPKIHLFGDIVRRRPHILRRALENVGEVRQEMVSIQ